MLKIFLKKFMWPHIYKKELKLYKKLKFTNL